MIIEVFLRQDSQSQLNCAPQLQGPVEYDPCLEVPYFPIRNVYIQLSGIIGNTKVTTYISKALKANMLLPPVHFVL